MRVNKLNKIEAYQDASYFTNIFSKAIKNAKKINKEHNLPNDFIVEGKRYYELPNGEITNQNPLNGINSVGIVVEPAVAK